MRKNMKTVMRIRTTWARLKWRSRSRNTKLFCWASLNVVRAH